MVWYSHLFQNVSFKMGKKVQAFSRSPFYIKPMNTWVVFQTPDTKVRCYESSENDLKVGTAKSILIMEDLRKGHVSKLFVCLIFQS